MWYVIDVMGFFGVTDIIGVMNIIDVMHVIGVIDVTSIIDVIVSKYCTRFVGMEVGLTVQIWNSRYYCW